MPEETADNVKIELELPKDRVSIEPAEEDGKPKASYKPGDIAKAPAQPPEPGSKAPPNSHQRTVMVFGFAVDIISLLVWPLFNFEVFIGVAVAGAAIIAFGTLVRF